MSEKKDSFMTWLHLFVLWNCCVKVVDCIILEDCYNEAVLRWGCF